MLEDIQKITSEEHLEPNEDSPKMIVWSPAMKVLQTCPTNAIFTQHRSFSCKE